MNSREIRKLISADDIYEWSAFGKGGCWDWVGSLHNDGYAAWNTGGKQIKVHRASYLLSVGPIPKNRFVVHTTLVNFNLAHLSGFRVPGSGFRVSGLGFRLQGLGFRV